MKNVALYTVLYIYLISYILSIWKVVLTLIKVSKLKELLCHVENITSQVWCAVTKFKFVKVYG